MAVRTDSDAVIALLAPGKDYDLVNLPSLTGFIASASVVVSRVATCAADKGITLSSEELELIERWLAAHYYKRSDLPYASKSTGGQSASFQTKIDMGIKGTHYGQSAIDMDPSGCLAALSSQARASIGWLGKNPPDQINYEDR